MRNFCLLQTGTWGWVAASFSWPPSNWLHQSGLPCTFSAWFNEIHMFECSRWCIKRPSKGILCLFCPSPHSCMWEGKCLLAVFLFVKPKLCVCIYGELLLVLQILEEENVYNLMTIGEYPLYIVPLDEDVLSFELDLAYKVRKNLFLSVLQIYTNYFSLCFWCLILFFYFDFLFSRTS